MMSLSKVIACTRPQNDNDEQPRSQPSHFQIALGQFCILSCVCFWMDERERGSQVELWSSLFNPTLFVQALPYLRPECVDQFGWWMSEWGLVIDWGVKKQMLVLQVW